MVARKTPCGAGPAGPPTNCTDASVKTMMLVNAYFGIVHDRRGQCSTRRKRCRDSRSSASGSLCPQLRRQQEDGPWRRYYYAPRTMFSAQRSRSARTPGAKVWMASAESQPLIAFARSSTQQSPDAMSGQPAGTLRRRRRSESARPELGIERPPARVIASSSQEWSQAACRENLQRAAPPARPAPHAIGTYRPSKNM